MPVFPASRLSLALSLVFASLAASAQQIPNIGDALRLAQPPAVPAPQASALPSLGSAPIEPAMQTLPGDGPTLRVQRFAVVGNRVIASATLLALVQSEQGQNLSLVQLDALATRITRHYRSAGYFVARAYIPAQEVQEGLLTIRVIEGQHGQFHLQNHSRVNDTVVQGLLDEVKGRGDVVSLDTLERAMLNINDTPGVKVVQADVMPGTQVGTSDFSIATEATEAYNGYLMLDNQGSVYTGKERLSFYGDWNSPTGRGDRLSASGLLTRGSGLLNGRLAYGMGVAGNGARAELALSHTQYELGGSYAALQATGTANAGEVGLSLPLQRTRARSLEARLTTTYKDLRDDVATTHTATGKKAASLTGSISLRSEHSMFGLDGQTQSSAALTLGRLGFKDATAAALDAAGAKTRGDYAKLNLAVSRTTLLPAQFTLATSAKAQWALSDKNMDGSERMSVSGAGGVAAYPSGELSGDQAVLLRVELAHPFALPLPSPLATVLQLSASVFADYGRASAAQPLPGATTRDLSDMGLGLTANAAGGLIKLVVAQRVGGGAATSEPSGRTRVLAQVGWVF